MPVLDLFHPLVARWFTDEIGTPTEIQTKAWPVIASGRHVLLTAPTGSGKTLTAFLWAVNRFIPKPRARQTLSSPAENSLRRVLYISPLKALNNDIQRNLEGPLFRLKELFAREGLDFPDITVGVRSGDTPQQERERMKRSPPDIFITTPESLNILLSSKGGRKMLGGFGTVILDEIHAVADSKRGVYLMSAVERLALLAGEFQRIALSATLRPISLIADFIGGYRLTGAVESSGYEKRPVEIVRTGTKKEYALFVDTPDEPEAQEDDDWWKILARSYGEIIGRHNSTLLFVNSRRMAEKLSRYIRETEAGSRVYAHHGSLSKEIRREVEMRLKEGALAGIVATGSLELGIDIGSVDAAVLVQCPFSVAQAVQRVGRAGHQVGEISRGIFFPVHTKDLAHAAVLAEAIHEGDIEEVTIPKNPLDVLSQVVLSMTLFEAVPLEELFSEVRCCWSFRDLGRKEFDLVIEMLAGRYADSRIRELKPRIYLDRTRQTVRARENSAMLLYMSGGVIPDRGYFTLRAADSKAKLGELDEEFVWERSVGETFPFGGSVWRIQRITHNDVEVVPAKNINAAIPFWRADELNRSFHLSEKIGLFFERVESILEAAGVAHPSVRSTTAKGGSSVSALLGILTRDHHMSEAAAARLIEFFIRQRHAAGSLPHRHNLLIEHYNDPASRSDVKQTLLHTFWGGRVNRPLAFALAAAWDKAYGYSLEVFANNDSILINLPHDFKTGDLLRLVTPENVVSLLREKLESTGFFGARFRDNAQRALLLPRKNFRERMPLWLNRLRSKKLLDAVSKYSDFPIVLETWRECFREGFDIDTLIELLRQVDTGEIAVAEAVTRVPSPLADEIIWRQTNYFMYEDDTPQSRLKTDLHEDLFSRLIDYDSLGTAFSDELIREFEEKLQRTAPGYAPTSPDELLLHVKERCVIPAEEWDRLLAAAEAERDFLLDPIRNEIRELTAVEDSTPAGGTPGVVIAASELLPKLQKAVQDPESPYSLDMLLEEWLRFYGPVTEEFIFSCFRSLLAPALSAEPKSRARPNSADSSSAKQAETDNFRRRLEQTLVEMTEDGRIYSGMLRKSSTGTELIDRENLEMLLRMRRSRARPKIEPLPPASIPFFLALHQGIVHPGSGIEALQARFEQLFGYPSKAGNWEAEILPARVDPFSPAWIDSLFTESGLGWFGSGNEEIYFAFAEDRELFQQQGPGANRETHTSSQPGVSRTDPPSRTQGLSDEESLLYGQLKERGKMDLSELILKTGMHSEEAARAVWSLAWKGLITNTTFSAVRKGVLNKFRYDTGARRDRPSGRRTGFSRWKNSRPFIGSWYIPPGEVSSPDPILQEELNRERVRILLDRYGIIFKELCRRELPALSWSNLLRTLRLMELSGELVAGRFFDGVSGLQFCSPGVLRKLTEFPPDEPVFWVNAADPASVCGLDIEALKGSLPSRISSNYVVYRGARPVLVVRKNGKEADCRFDPGSPRAQEYLQVFHHLVARDFNPFSAVKTEIINQVSAGESSYLDDFLAAGFRKDYKTLVLRKQY
jgi:ATP-dependent Lhr-like helicase